MSDLNDVKLSGRIVRDATIMSVESGLKVARFSIAVNRAYKGADGEYVSTGHFFPLAIYGGYAEKMHPHLKKGRRVIIEGFLKQDRWTTEDGKRRSATTIGVSAIHLIFDARKATSESPLEEGQHELSEDFAPTVEQMQEMYESESEGGDFIDSEDIHPRGEIF